MKKKGFYLALACTFAIVLAACAPGGTGEQEQQGAANMNQAANENEEGLADVTQELNGADATAMLENRDGDDAGTVEFYENEDGNTLVSVEAKQLSPGYHGWHVAEAGICEANVDEGEGAFDSSGDHYSPEANNHGEQEGDLPPLYVKEDGMAEMSFETDQFVPEDLVSEGTSIIVHHDPDNFGHIPDRYQSDDHDAPGPDRETLSTGDAGDRIACGVIE